jgi:hypothetical protein
MAGLFGKLAGGLGGLSSGDGGGALLGIVTHVLDQLGSLRGVSGDAGNALGGLGGVGDVAGVGDDPQEALNGHSVNDAVHSDPVSLETGTGKLWLSVLSGDDASHDNSTVGLDVLSFTQSAEDGAPPATLVLGPEDATNLDVDILSGSYGSGGTGGISLGPDIWGGGSPLSLGVLQNPDDPFANDVHVGGNALDPATDGTLTDGVLAHVPVDPIDAIFG